MADENQPNRKRTYLDVPFKEKDAANEAGAKFDRRSKKWYVPAGTDVEPFKQWLPKRDPQASRPPSATRRGTDASRIEEPAKLLGSEDDFEREAVRISEVMGLPIDDAREFVRETVRAAEERAALVARDHYLKDGRAFEAMDRIRETVLRARHLYFAEVQQVHAPSTSGDDVQPAPAEHTRANLDDAALGRLYREAIQSIAASATVRGDEVSRTLLLDQRLETIHRDAWRKSGNPADGDRAIGEQIRTRTGFAADELPPQAAKALDKLRQEAELSPMEADERTPVTDVPDTTSRDDAELADRVSVVPAHQHRPPELDPDASMATFADVADAFEQEEASQAHGRNDGAEPTVADQSAVSPEAKVDWIAENAQSSKLIADRRGLTDRIESGFAQGKTAAQVTTELDKDLSFLPLMERGTFVIYVRHALGIPSQATEEGKQEFEQWKADYDSRNTISADLAPTELSNLDEQPDEKPAVQDSEDVVTFADVGEAPIIDDAMRSRGLTEDAAPGVARTVDQSTVNAAVANERVAEPGKAANDASDAPVLDGTPGPAVRQPGAPAQNEADAKHAANEQTRGRPEAVSEEDLKRLGKVRESERKAAEELLRKQGTPISKVDGPDEGKSTDVGDAGDNQIGVDPASRKPIVKKDGYDVPTAIASRYMVKEGRFWKVDGTGAKPDKPGTTPTMNPHFEDVGARLKTQQNDRATIADMLAIAEAKNWDSIVVRGDETFRRHAWIEASLRGADMSRFKGFKPKESDEALLEIAKRERAALTIKAGKSSEPSSDEKQGHEKQDPKADRPGKEAAKPTKPEAPDTLSGVLLEHGSARYQHKPDASRSYFVRYQDEAGEERTVWGVDLKRAMTESGAKVGDTVSLKNLGETPVTVEELVRDANGKVVGKQEKETIRNTWEVKRTASAEPERAAPAPERAPLTVKQMREQLVQSIERLPARTRTEVLNRFDARMQAGTEVEARIARGELSRDAGEAEIGKRAAELHATWTAPKAAPNASPSNTPQVEQQQTRGPMPSRM